MVDLYPHQRKAVEALGNGKVLWADPGAGKTLTALAYFFEKVCGGTLNDFSSIKTPKHIYVITTARKRDTMDWQTDAAMMSIGPDPEKSIAGIKLTVDSWNNVDNYLDTKDAFFIFDEQRAVGKGKWSKSFVKIAKQNEWIMLTGTPGDTWMDYIPLFLANGLYKNKTEFTREHVTWAPYVKFPKVEKYNQVGKLLKHRNNLLVRMHFTRHTVRKSTDVPVTYDKDLLHKVASGRWHVYEDRPLKDVAEMFLVMRKVVNSDPSRVDAIRSLMVRHPRLIVFYTFDYELELLRELADSTTVAEWNGHKHQEVPEGDSWVYLVQYVAGAEAWNCTTTDTVVFYSLTYSYKNFQQAMGRIDRLNTPFTYLNYYILLSKAAIDLAIARALSHKENFNESSFYN